MSSKLTKEEIDDKRAEFDRILTDWGYEEGFKFLQNDLASPDLRMAELKNKKPSPPDLRKAVLKDNDTSLDILFSIFAKAVANKATKESELKKILYMIAQVIEMSDFTAKFKLTSSIVRLFNSIADDDVNPSKQIIKAAIRAQGGGLIEFYSDETSRAGHLLGIPATVTFTSGKNKVYVQKSEGSFHHISLGWFGGLIKKYREDQPITPGSKILIARFERALSGTDPQLKIIPTGFTGHAIYVAILGDKLILSNRGARDTEASGGVKIFKLKPGAKVNLGIYATAAEFEEALSNLVDLKHPEKTFHEIKPQLHGNCTFANLKGLITPYMYLSVPESERANVHDVYKLLTNWMRNQELDRLIFELNAAHTSNNKEKERFYAGLLIRYIRYFFIKTITLKELPTTLKGQQDKERFVKALGALDDTKKYKPFIRMCLKILGEFKPTGDEGKIIETLKPLTEYCKENKIELDINAAQINPSTPSTKPAT